MKKQISIFIIIVSILFAASGASIYYLSLQKGDSTIAKVSLYGQEVATFDLSEVEKPFEYFIDNQRGGTNTLLIEPDQISIVHANCPDKLCIHRGTISTSALPIVCLPNGVTIEIIQDKDPSSIEIDTLAE
jgi:hypothetical protein